MGAEGVTTLVWSVFGLCCVFVVPWKRIPDAMSRFSQEILLAVIIILTFAISLGTLFMALSS